MYTRFKIVKKKDALSGEDEHMKKNSVLTGMIYLVILVLYNLAIFFIVKNFNTVFWVSYAFMTIVYVLHAALTIGASAASKEKRFMEIPLIVYSSVFIGIEFVLSTVFMIAKSIVGIKIVITIQAILLGIYIICIIVSLIRKNTFAEKADLVKSNVMFIQGIAVDIELLIDRCTDSEIKKQLKALHETVKYSDPMSNSVVAREEDMICDAVVELKEIFDNENMDEASSLIKRLKRLFDERNKKMLVTK